MAKVSPFSYFEKLERLNVSIHFPSLWMNSQSVTMKMKQYFFGTVNICAEVRGGSNVPMKE